MSDTGPPIPSPGDPGYPDQEEVAYELPPAIHCILCGGDEMSWELVVPPWGGDDEASGVPTSFVERAYSTATCVECRHVLWFSR